MSKNTSNNEFIFGKAPENTTAYSIKNEKPKEFEKLSSLYMLKYGGEQSITRPDFKYLDKKAVMKPKKLLKKTLITPKPLIKKVKKVKLCKCGKQINKISKMCSKCRLEHRKANKKTPAKRTSYGAMSTGLWKNKEFHFPTEAISIGKDRNYFKNMDRDLFAYMQKIGSTPSGGYLAYMKQAGKLKLELMDRLEELSIEELLSFNKRLVRVRIYTYGSACSVLLRSLKKEKVIRQPSLVYFQKMLIILKELKKWTKQLNK